MTQQATDATFAPTGLAHAEERTYAKVTARIVPFLFICYLAAYLDRVNVGFAKLQMLNELKFSEPSTVWAPASFSWATCCSKCRATSFCTKLAPGCGSRAS